MKCLFCQQETPTNTRTGRKRKYCSKRCSAKFYQKEGRYNKFKGEKAANPNSNYGEQSRRAKEEKTKRKEEYEWYKENWLTKEQIAELIGTTPYAVWHRAKTLNIKYKLVGHAQGGNRAFFNPEDIEKFKYKETPIPEGFLTMEEAAQYLGLASKSAFSSYFGKYGTPEHIEWRETHGNKSLRHIYKKDKLDEWMSNIRKTQEEKRKAIEKARQKAKEDKIKQEQKIAAKKITEFKRKTKGLITKKAAIALMGYKSHHILDKYRDKLDPKKINCPGINAPSRLRFYYDPNKVKQLAHELEQEKLLKTKERKERRLKLGLNRANTPLRKDDWTSVEAYEKRFWKRIQKYGLPAYARDTKLGHRALEANKLYRDNAAKGIVTKLNCSGCKKQLPYTSFHADFKTRRGRQFKCKPCFKKVKKPVNHNPSSPQQRMRILIGNTIKQSLSKRNGEFLDMSIREIWDNIEKYCNYNCEQLTNHLQSHFSKRMSWDNHGRPTRGGEFRWQIDHIQPRSSFEYKSFSDPGFAMCWSLQNLKPLEARMNILKSDKSLRQAMNASFRHGLTKDANYKSGIWKYLPYNTNQARKHFESLFDEHMNWENYGTYWQIDHVISQAYLSYTSTEQENFKLCWSLGNLQPLNIQENSAKSSIHKGVFWFYNDT